jgi:hypothetical protein
VYTTVDLPCTLRDVCKSVFSGCRDVPILLYVKLLVFSTFYFNVFLFFFLRSLFHSILSFPQSIFILNSFFPIKLATNNLTWQQQIQSHSYRFWHENTTLFSSGGKILHCAVSLRKSVYNENVFVKNGCTTHLLRCVNSSPTIQCWLHSQNTVNCNTSNIVLGGG